MLSIFPYKECQNPLTPCTEGVTFPLWNRKAGTPGEQMEKVFKTNLETEALAAFYAAEERLLAEASA